MMSGVPILRPKLPVADRVVGYLRRIDEERFYTNFGPLVTVLEDRIAQHYGLDSGAVTTVANATLGLTLALMAEGAQRGTLCAMPAWTFVASAHAAAGAGLVPYFIDVDPYTWALDPEAILSEITRAPGPVGAVMPVAPFGRPIDIARWDAFRAESKLAVVVDAAAGFDSLIPGNAPAVVSLHATKVLSSGEGGLVVSRDPSLIEEVRARSNFGFHGSRLARFTSTNAKMSEYHAAVGLAALDEWREARGEWMDLAAAYRRAFAGSNRIRLQEGFGQSWVSGICVLRATEPPTLRFEQTLAAAEVETRQWWGSGAHLHPATADYPRAALPITKGLAAATFGVPFYRDLAAPQITQIAETVLGCSEAV
jgi:dTDP-4-amino-4,6-dideoxygalactose transaminase